jgi:cell division protein FtsB
MKALLLIFSTILVLLIVGLWVGSGSYPEHWKTEDRISAQEDSNKQRKDDIERIKADLEDVATGDSAIEERARSELGMTKENESFFEIILRPDKKQQPLIEDKVKGRDLGNPELKSGKPLGVKSMLAPQPSTKNLLDTKPNETPAIDDIGDDENNKIDSEIENSKDDG